MSSTEQAASPEHQKSYEIYINGRPREVTESQLSFEQVVRLAYDPPPAGENVQITVVFRRGHGNKPEGSLMPGQVLKIKEGMIIDVTATDKS